MISDGSVLTVLFRLRAWTNAAVILVYERFCAANYLMVITPMPIT